MDNIERRVTLVCLLCGSPLQGPEDAEYASGDMIDCNECGESNDYDSIIEVAKEKGMAEGSEEIQRQLKKEFGNLFKKN